METLFWIIVVVLPVVALVLVSLVYGRLVRMEGQINSTHISLSAVREQLFKLENGPKPESTYGRVPMEAGDVMKKPPVLDVPAPPIIGASVYDVKPAAPSVSRADAPDVDTVAPMVVHERDVKELPERQPETTTWETTTDPVNVGKT